MPGRALTPAEPEPPPCCLERLRDLAQTLALDMAPLEPDSVAEQTVEATQRAALNRWRWHQREHRRSR